MKLYAYAKLNLALKIIGQRPDGYHELDMVMQRISLHDEVSVDKSEGITVRCDTHLPPDNTLFKAATLFFETTGIRGGADLFVQKNIPEQAGMGGGSSDGATVLMALNELYAAGLTKVELIELGKKIGADVPFFIEGGCARAQGTGDILTPLRNNMDCVYLLAKPAAGVGTKDAYSMYHQCAKQDIDINRTIKAIQDGDIAAYAMAAGNDLAPAALRLCPDILRIQNEMSNAAAALVTGSGSCVFGIYRDKKTAQKNLERLSALPFVRFVYLAENK